MVRESEHPAPAAPDAAPRFLNPAIAALSAVLLGYTALRAGLLAYTFDESNTFLLHVPMSFFDIVVQHRPSANNHVINTLLTKSAYVIFGGSDFFLRLPNVFAHALYLGATVSILRTLRDPILILAGFVALNFNPFLLDHFSISRGYGIALAAMLASVAMLLRGVRAPASRAGTFAFAFSVVAVLANYTLANYYAGLVAVWYAAFVGHAVVLRIRGRALFALFLRTSLPVAVSAGILFLFAFDAYLNLASFDSFYYGGSTGFFGDTIGKTLEAALYGTLSRGPLFELLRLGVLAVGLAATALVGSRVAKDGMRAFHAEIGVAWLLLFVPIASSLVQHLTLGTPYLMVRTALFLLPLLALNLVFVVGALAPTRPALGRALLIAAAAGCLVNTAASANLSHTHEWAFNADVRRVLDDLEASREPDASPVRLGVDFLFRPSIDYYRNTRNLDWIVEVDGQRRRDNRRKCGGGCTHYYVFTREGERPGDEMGPRERVSIDSHDVIARYPDTQTVLVGTPLR